MEQGATLSKDYIKTVNASVEKVGQAQANKAIIAKLLAGDVAGASKEARLALDAMPDDAARKLVAAGLSPLFDAERERSLDALKDKPLSAKGDYLAQYRDAPPEVAQPMAQAVADKFGDLSAQMATQGASGGARFIAGLSVLAEAADSRSADPQWSERFAAELTKQPAATGGTGLTPAVLRDGARLAVEGGGQAKLATQLANSFDKLAKDPAKNPTAAASRFPTTRRAFRHGRRSKRSASAQHPSGTGCRPCASALPRSLRSGRSACGIACARARMLRSCAP